MRDAFEIRDFYLACFLRCSGYNLIGLRAEGRRKVFVFRDRPSRYEDVLAFYGDGAAVPRAPADARIGRCPGRAAPRERQRGPAGCDRADRPTAASAGTPRRFRCGAKVRTRSERSGHAESVGSGRSDENASKRLSMPQCGN